MYGTNYAPYPEILIDSFSRINQSYTARSPKFIPKPWLSLYIRLFGIPDVSFQLRAKYFVQIISSLPDFHPRSILDAGSGIGFYTFWLAEHFPGAQITAMDTDQTKLDFCRQYAREHSLTNINFIRQDLTRPQLAGKYDLIVNIDVLEHIKNYHQVLKSFYRLLKPGGYLYIHTPQTNQHRYFKKFFSSWEHADHAREGFAPQQLKNELKQLGFSSIQYWHGIGPTASLAWEFQHLVLSRSPILSALLYPGFYLLTKLDRLTDNFSGLTLSLLARK